MTTAAPKLTIEQFEEQYGHCERAHEFWYGEAVPKGLPNWVHALLQQIISELLKRAGYIPASELELRIEDGARPRPDIVATRTKPSGRYPTSGLEVVVEILSEDDRYLRVQEHCRKYQDWGFGHIYLVNPADRSTVEWRDGGQTPVHFLAGIPVERIWQELDAQYDSGAE